MKRRTILDVIKYKTVEVDGCMNWTGYVNGKTPSTSIGGRGMSVRGLIALRLGIDAKGKVVTNSCGNNLCVRPEHIKLMDKGKFHSYISKTKVDSQAWSRRAKLSAAVRKRSKLTAEIAAQIRAEQITHKQIAEKYGVCKSTVDRIRRGESWRDYGMFGQLWRTP